MQQSAVKLSETEFNVLAGEKIEDNLFYKIYTSIFLIKKLNFQSNNSINNKMIYYIENVVMM